MVVRYYVASFISVVPLSTMPVTGTTIVSNNNFIYNACSKWILEQSLIVKALLLFAFGVTVTTSLML